MSMGKGLVARGYSCLFNFLVDICLATTKPEVVSVYLAFIQKLFSITKKITSFFSIRSLVSKIQLQYLIKSQISWWLFYVLLLFSNSESLKKKIGFIRKRESLFFSVQMSVFEQQQKAVGLGPKRKSILFFSFLFFLPILMASPV